MYLVCNKNYSPVAVFDCFDNAKNFLAANENANQKTVMTEQINNSFMFRVYIENYSNVAETSIGYITAGIPINPNF